eukprot:PLAT3339.61.p1 GENE.PLAT3339.61~~PLAT3339.61.p1  ORF type:complete len:639 (+),score=219.59 PLAT3339.61:101-2017(+)
MGDAGEGVDLTKAVRVAVRIRPFLPREVTTAQAIMEDGPGKLMLRRRGEVYPMKFHRVFGLDSSQADVYDFVRPAVAAVARGFGSTIFTYGQTGAGKTFTLVGRDGLDMTAPELPEDSGIIPRAVRELFTVMAGARDDGDDVSVECSYMQIYNDRVYDLITDRKLRHALELHEIGAEVEVSGLTAYSVERAEDVLTLLQFGGRSRVVRSTNANARSSRSHVILQLTVRRSSGRRMQRCKLNLVDLAGSEKFHNIVSGSKRHLKEMAHINKSLSALGLCLAALLEKGRRHIPYRDCSLTRLLADSLGGKACTTLVAAVSPSDEVAEETFSTLQFAKRAKDVKLAVGVREVATKKTKLAVAEREIERLRALVLSQRSKLEAVEEENLVLKRHMAALSPRAAGMDGPEVDSDAFAAAVAVADAAAAAAASSADLSPRGSHWQPPGGAVRPLHGQTAGESSLPTVGEGSSMRTPGRRRTRKKRRRQRSKKDESTLRRIHSAYGTSSSLRHGTRRARDDSEVRARRSHHAGMRRRMKTAHGYSPRRPALPSARVLGSERGTPASRRRALRGHSHGDGDAHGEDCGCETVVVDEWGPPPPRTPPRTKRRRRKKKSRRVKERARDDRWDGLGGSMPGGDVLIMAR